MAVLRCDFFAESLSLNTSMTVILPQQTSTQIGMAGAATGDPPPVLYLLHGLSDDDSIWLRRTSIERYAAPLGLAVVMPAVARSFYADEVYGGRYWTFLHEELPALVDSFFRVSQRREDTFVAGLSMGGYAALKWALREPSRFAAAASLSGALDLSRVGRARPEDPQLTNRIWGGVEIPAGDDLFALLEQADPATLPALCVCAGTEDPVVEGNRRFLAHCEQHGVPVTSDLGPGAHEWGYWDEHIQHVLAWLPLPGRD